MDGGGHRGVRPGDGGHGDGSRPGLLVHRIVNRWGKPPANLAAVSTALGLQPPVGATALGLSPTPSPSRGPVADLHLATVDTQGRLGLHQPARLVGWAPHRRVTLSVQDPVVRLTDRTGRASGVDVTFDRRCRILVPFGLRSLVGLHPGVRVLVVAVPDEGTLAVLPVDQVVAAFARRR